MEQLPQSQQPNSLTLSTRNLSPVVVKALRAWQDSPEQYYAELPIPSTSKEIILSEAPPLSVIKSNLGQAGVRAIIVLAVSEVVLFFNVGKNMSASQIALTTDLILEQYWYLTVEEIKACFRRAMRSAKVYDRLDGNIILGWLRDYDCERDEIMVQINIDEKNRLENLRPDPSTGGISYADYVAGVKARAERGDERASQLLEDIEMNEARRQTFGRGLSDAELRRWYVTEYLPNKSKEQK